MSHLLVVDDEQSICWGLAQLGRQMGHTVATAATAELAFDAARTHTPDAIVLDVRLPGMDGLTAMRHFRQALGDVPIIIVTAHGNLSTAVEAVRNGAFDYLVKPFDLDAAQRAIRRAIDSRKAPSGPAVNRLAEDPEGPIVGVSPGMQEVFKRIALVAPSDACVHLRGESGTGKELVARAIHRYSRRAAGPFVAVNIASLNASLAESELFGHARGAFTGADHSRRGLLEQAGGGTIFLDEVADIPPEVQVKLLRVLEYGEVLPVGGDRSIQVDFRVVSATHQDLAQRVAQGRFRHDLYFRLITLQIDLPPLRERPEDIPVLTHHFLGLLAAGNQGPPPAISQEAMIELQGRPWYGNVRELRNAVEHAMILARDSLLAPEHLPPPTPPALGANAGPEEQLGALVRQWAERQCQASPDTTDLYDRLMRLVEPPLLQAVLREHHGQCSAAARRLGLHRTTLRKKLDDFGIGQT